MQAIEHLHPMVGWQAVNMKLKVELVEMVVVMTLWILTKY
jgi:heme O synthase-like polyprenyltransferase